MQKIEFINGKVRLEKSVMNKYSGVAAIRKVHAQGARFGKAELLRNTPVERYKNLPSVAAIKSDTRPAMRKIGLPGQDNDIVDRSGIADTGATNNWHDQNSNGDTPKPTVVGGQMFGAPNRSDMQAAIDSIKKDWARGLKRGL